MGTPWTPWSPFSRGRWAGSRMSECQWPQRPKRGWQLRWWELTGPLGKGGDFTRVLTINARCYVTGLGRMEITEKFYMYVKCVLDNIAYMALTGTALLLHLYCCASYRNSNLIKYCVSCTSFIASSHPQDPHGWIFPFIICRMSNNPGFPWCS